MTSVSATSTSHIRHNSYPATLLAQLKLQRTENILTNIEVCANDGQQFPCHRCILAAASPYFSAMFTTSGMEEGHSHKVVLQNISGTILAKFIDYCYTGELTITEESVTDMAEVASFLGFAAVEDDCVSFLKDHLCADNSIETEQVAERLFNRQLSAQAHDYTVSNFTDVTFSAEYLEFTMEQVEAFIGQDGGVMVEVEMEEEVYEGVMRWVYHDVDERKTNLTGLMKNILVELMADDYVLEIAAREPLFQEFDECMKIVKKARTFHAAHNGGAHSSRVGALHQISLRAQSMRCFSEVIILVGQQKFCNREAGPTSNSSNLLLYDPWRLIWTELPEAPFTGTAEFSNLAAVVENDFLVLTNHHRAWLYLTQQKKWSLVTPNMDHRRNGGCLVTLQNQVFILGGLKPVDAYCLRNVQYLNLATKQWSDVVPMLPGMTHAVGTACLEKIYVVGTTLGGHFTKEMFCYAFNTDHWVECPPVPVKVMRPRLTAVNGCLYVLGHSSDFAMAMVRFDVRNQIWTEVDAPLVARHGAFLTVCNNKMFLIGGKVLESDYGETVEFTIESYDPDTELWSIHDELPWLLNSCQTLTVLNPALPPSRFLGPKQH